MTFYYSVKQKKKYSTSDWQVVQLYNEQNNFLGPAIFTDKKSAEEYLKFYQARLEKRNQETNSNNPDMKSDVINLKIVRESEKPQLTALIEGIFKRWHH